MLRVEQDLPLHRSPGGPPFATLPATQLRNPTWVPVIAQRGRWARVLLPSRPNGATGWVDTADPARTSQARSPYLVRVDLAAHRMVVHENGRTKGAWTVGAGSPEAPTPRGRTFLLASIDETVSQYSPIILPLGTHSQTLDTFGGGPGTVALHSWPDPSVFGQDSSNGCVRVPADALRVLASLPLGTMVLLD